MKKEPEWIMGLPFYTPSNYMEENMTVGSLIEELINVKRKYEIGYPDDNYINLACNVLEGMDGQRSIYELLEEMREKKKTNVGTGN